MTDVQTLTSSARERESVTAFAQWAHTALQREAEAGDHPQRQAAAATPREPLPPWDTAASVEQQLRWLTSLSQTAGPIVFEATPVDDVQHVRDLSAWILGKYHARQGHVELAGCTLDPRPFLRLTFLSPQPDRLDHAWFGGDGQRIDGDLTQRLGLARLQPAAARLRTSDRQMIEQWIAAALAGCRRADGSAGPGGTDAADGRLLAATIVWCRWASGKVAIAFNDGAQRVEIPFDGWAGDYRSGRLLPPPYHCVESGIASHHVCVLPDGTVTVIEALARCEQSGAEVLATRLGTCEVTGRRAQRDLLVSCAVSGRPALADAAARCQWCGRQVLPSELQAGRCGDCRHGAPIAAHDPLLRQLLTRRPTLARYKHWRGWRSDQVAVLVGSRWSGERVLICDAGTGEVRREGQRSRWRRQWQMLS